MVYLRRKKKRMQRTVRSSAAHSNVEIVTIVAIVALVAILLLFLNRQAGNSLCSSPDSQMAIQQAPGQPFPPIKIKAPPVGELPEPNPSIP